MIGCPYCDNIIAWADITIGGTYHCHHCRRAFTIVAETTSAFENTYKADLAEILPVLENGEMVLLDNEDHPWHNEIALICGKRHKFYQLELREKRLWVPEEWVKQIDDLHNDSDT